MLELINNTGSTSVIGKAVVLDSNNSNAFVLAPPTSTKVIGIIGQSSPYRQKCKIATSGEKAQVLVSGNIVKDDVLRLSKTTDRVSLGVSTKAKTTDTGYVKIGVALQSGNGLIDCLLDFSYVSASGSGSLGEEFETVSKNLKSYPYTLTYGVDGIDTIVYDLGGGLSVTKNFNYTLSVLTSIVLSGDTPAGIELTKTLNYTGVDLTSVTYS